MGLSAAYALSQTRHKITLYDPKGVPANNASSMAGGMLAPYAEIEHMPQAFIEAGLEGIKIWQNIMPDQIRQNGSLLIAHDEDRYILERFKQHLPPEKQISVEPLEPQLPKKFTSMLHLKEEAHLDPAPTLSKLCDMLKDKGCIFQSSTYAPAHQNDYDYVIDCRGMGAAQDDPDLRGVKGEILIVQNKEFSLSRPVRLMHPRYPLYIVPREDNIFMIGATNIESAGDGVSLRSGLELMSALYSLHPSFGEAQIIDMKAGIRPAYPDNFPRITIEDNVIRCNGLFRHGFLLAPVMAECVTDYTENRHNKFTDLFWRDNNDPDHQRSEKDLRNAA
ncbi:MAG: glycine oxidase [Micavibrio sp.]|nr:MAG: glycine oxidase [Micavibrio sp.]